MPRLCRQGWTGAESALFRFHHFVWFLSSGLAAVDPPPFQLLGFVPDMGPVALTDFGLVHFLDDRGEVVEAGDQHGCLTVEQSNILANTAEPDGSFDLRQRDSLRMEVP